MGDYAEYIPFELQSPVLEVKDERDLLYLGYNNLKYYSEYWMKRYNELTQKICACSDPLERAYILSEASDYRNKSRILDILATRAENKPEFYHHHVAYPVGCRLTYCVLNGSLAATSKHIKPNSFIKSVVLGSIQHDDYECYYTVRVYSHDLEEPGSIKLSISRDDICAFPTIDFPYLKTHPNYFRLYLNVRAVNDIERAKIEPILSAIVP